MIIRIWNDDSTDYADYEADTVEEIKEMCKDRIECAGWTHGWSEIIEQ